MYVLKMSYKIYRKYQLAITNLDIVTMIFHNAAIKYKSLAHSSYILYNRNKSYVSKISSRYKGFVEDITASIKDYLEEIIGEPSEEMLYFMTFTMLSTWYKLIPTLDKMFNRAKVLVISRFSDTHTDSMRDQLELYFGNYIDFETYKSPYISLEDISNSDCDLVIADFNTSITISKPWIYLNGSKSLEDLKLVFDTLNKIVQKKSEHV